MANVSKGNFGGTDRPREPSGWEGYEEAPENVHQYAFSGSNIHKIVVTTDVPAPSRAPRASKAQPTPPSPAGGQPGSTQGSPSKDRFEFTIPPSLEPAIRALASVAREQLIERPSELADMGAAIRLLVRSEEWRSVLAALANAEQAQQPCAYVCRPLIELVLAGEHEAVKRIGWFVVRLKKDPKGETRWYDQARAWVMPSLGDVVLDATSRRGRLIRWLARRTFAYNWDRAMASRLVIRMKQAETKARDTEGTS